MSKIKVLYIIPSLAKGGAERLMLNLCNELKNDKGFDIKLVCLHKINEFENLSANIDAEVCESKYIPSIFKKPVKDLAALKNCIQNFKPDIIHSNLFEAEITSRQIIIPDVIYITHCHDNMAQFKNFSIRTLLKKEIFTAYYEKLLMIKQYRKCNNNFIAISEDTSDYFKRCLPPALRKITFIPNAIDINRFYTGNEKVIMEGEMTNLVTTGSLTNKKNHMFLVDVIDLLVRKNISVHLDILGEGPNRNLLERKIELAGLGSNIRLRGNVNNVEEYLHKSHIYLHPATYEPFGLAILEAMAAGLPCISIDGKGNRDIMANGYNGFIIRDINPVSFAEKIMSLIDDTGLYTKLSLNCREFVKKYDIRQYSSTVAGYYKRLLNRKE